MDYGDTAHLIRGAQIDPKRVFESDLNYALQLDASIVPGYGLLPPGCLVGEISESTNRKGMLVPYAVQAPTVGLSFIAGAYLLQDGAADAYCHVTQDDSYKFAVGDHLGAVDSDGSPVDLGAVVSIDRTTYSNKAVITVTNDVTTGITIAKGGMIFIQTDASTPFSTAIGLLAGAYETGTGEHAQGADVSVVYSNVIAKYALIDNYDAGGLADLSGFIHRNRYMIIR